MLYTKYRPLTFDQVSGQKQTIRVLQNAIKNNRIGHAYLFTGPRGTGKTTLARIFARAINCTNQSRPCNQCINCKTILKNKTVDIVEIDAASHTGVDNIRQLKETVNLPPSALSYKVYIIDEVHMLSIGAFNALLKTLEEPPTYVVFILATTELHKVPETIVSRCQRFDITRLSQEQIIQRLGQLAQNEGVKIDKEALETIALESEGSMRDAESLLAQIISLEDTEVTATEVNEILGTSSQKMVLDFFDLIVNNQTQAALEKIDSLQNEGVNLNNFNKRLLSFLRNTLSLKAGATQNQSINASFSAEQINQVNALLEKITLSKLIELIELFQKSLNNAKTTTIPQLPLEMAVVKYLVDSTTDYTNSTDLEKNQPKVNSLPKQKSTPIPAPPPPTPEPASIPGPELKLEPEVTEKPQEDPGRGRTSSAPTEELPQIKLVAILENWGKILEEVNNENKSIHAMLANCNVQGLLEDSLYIKAPSEFAKKQLSSINNQLTVKTAIDRICNTQIKLSFITQEESSNLNFAQDPRNQTDSPLLDAMKIMGGKIVKDTGV